MRKILGAVLIAALAASGGGQVHARTSVPIINHESVTVMPGSGRTPSEADVAKAVREAAASLGWQVTDAGPGQMVATIVVRGKHTVSTDIRYTPQNFSVKYRSSVNMNYEPAEGVPGIIHPNYNRWVQSLVDAIRTRTSAL